MVDKTFDLFCELGASDEQTDFPIVFCSAINRVSGITMDDMKDDMSDMFKQILVSSRGQLASTRCACLARAASDLPRMRCLRRAGPAQAEG